MYRLLERFLELSLMFEDMIDTLLGAHGNLLLLVGAAQYQVYIHVQKMDLNPASLYVSRKYTNSAILTLKMIEWFEL